MSTALYATRNDGKPLFGSSVTGCTKEETKTLECAGQAPIFSIVHFIYKKNEGKLDGNEAKNEMQHATLCNNEHMLRFNKMPHLGPRYFVQSLGTCVLCLRTWRTVFLIDMLPDANTDAPVEDGGGYSCFLNQSASPFSSIILVSRCPIFTSSSPCCVRDS